MQQSLFLWDEGMKVDPGCSCRRGHATFSTVLFQPCLLIINSATHLEDKPFNPSLVIHSPTWINGL